jgi:hypothetical protein
MPQLSRVAIRILQTAASAAVILLISAGLSLSSVFGRTATGFAVHAPRAVATGTPIPLRGEGAQPGEMIELERLDGGQWRHVASLAADTRGRCSYIYIGPRRQFVVTSSALEDLFTPKPQKSACAHGT